MSVDMQMCAAKIARQIMLSHGRPRSLVFNNIYKTGTRTVKCYTGPNGNPALEHSLRHVMSMLPVKWEIRRTAGRSYYGGAGLIVRFPAQK